MKSIYAIIILLISCSCDFSSEKSRVIEEETKKMFFSTNFKKAKFENQIIEINLDSFNNYSELRKEMGKHTCKGKTSGLIFDFKGTTYHVTGFSRCPDDNSTACYFTPNQFNVKNDSLVIRFFNSKKPIECIKAELDSIVSKNSSYYFGHDKKLRNVIIHLFIEDQYSIATTKKVLKEVEESFDKLIKREDLEPFKYFILFESFSRADFKAPPPPKPLNGNIKSKS